MKFKGSKGLIVGGVEFESDIFETDDNKIIKMFANHPGLNLFFSVYKDNAIRLKEEREEKKENPKSQKIKELQERGLELAKLTAKEVGLIAQGYGYAGEQSTKDDLIIWILKKEQELAKEGQDES